MINKSKVTVILNVYKRLRNLPKQIEAVNSQTIKPSKLLIWQNKGNEKFPEEFLSKALVSQNNFNYGVWARFAFALNATTEYVCIFDDDTIPGKKWFENCLSTMKSYEGLLGARGLRFKSKYRYTPNIDFGWNNPSHNTNKVDIVGHSWFFKREWLATFWRELPPHDFSNIVGEDIHFSYTLQKYLGLNTYVPPHPPDDFDLWGSQPILASELGNDKEAISMQDDSILKFNKALKYYTKNGFKLCFEEDNSLKKEYIIGNGLSSFIFLKKIFKKNKFLYRFVLRINERFKKYGIHF